MKKSLKIALIAGMILLPLLFALGCGPIDQGDRQSPVWVQIESALYETGEDDITVAIMDVCDTVTDTDTNVISCNYVDETANITFRVYRTSPDSEEPLDPPPNTYYLDVHLTKYRISYFRNDGGTDVPGTFEVYTDIYIPFATATVTYGVKILHADQKVDPPLIWLNTLESFGYEPSTGLSIIKGYVKLQFWGKDNAGYNVYCETQIPYQFADWADDPTVTNG